MGRIDFPYRHANIDIRRSQNFIGMMIKFLWMGGVLLFYGIVALFKLISTYMRKQNKDDNVLSSCKIKQEKNSRISFAELTNRRWLILIDDADYNCDTAIAENSCIYINFKNRRANIGDTVYLYIAGVKRVKYESSIVAIDIDRENPKNVICKAEIMGEYKGRALTLSKLKQNGLKSERAIILPMCNNMDLLDYIEEQSFNPICIE